MRKNEYSNIRKWINTFDKKIFMRIRYIYIGNLCANMTKMTKTTQTTPSASSPVTVFLFAEKLLSLWF